MKTLKIIALVLVIAMIGTILVACSDEKVYETGAQMAMTDWLNAINGSASTVLHLDLDAVEIVSMKYHYFTFEDDSNPNLSEEERKYPIYIYEIVATTTYDEKVSTEKEYYYSVVYRNESYTVHSTNKTQVEKDLDEYKTKKGSFGKKDIKKMLDVAKEELQKNVTARKAAADEQARIAEAEEAEKDVLRAAANQLAEGIVGAYASNSITADTTQDALIALLKAACPQFKYVNDYPEIEEGNETIYVRVPAPKAAGYAASVYDVEIFNYKYMGGLFVQGANGTAEKTTVLPR